jgi:SAM-dependent methyltransferase
MIPRAAVEQAFALCLRRPVGGEDVYAFFTGLPSLDAVYETLFESPEFRGRLVTKPEEKGFAPQDVEVHAAPDGLAQMVAHVEATWTRLGETEPHWSVITEPRFKSGQIAAHEAVYRDYGRQDDERFGFACARAGVGLSRFGTCFELGCGTGRVTEFLAKRFGRVIGADISHAHLAAARLALADVPNVSLLPVGRLDDLTQLPDYDFLYSRIVLQHNPPPVIAVILSRLLAGLAPGGGAFVQVPVWIPGYRFQVAEYLAGLQTGPMEMHALPQRDLLAIVHGAGCVIRELREDPLGPQFGGISNTLVLEKG